MDQRSQNTQDNQPQRRLPPAYNSNPFDFVSRLPPSRPTLLGSSALYSATLPPDFRSLAPVPPSASQATSRTGPIHPQRETWVEALRNHHRELDTNPHRKRRFSTLASSPDSSLRPHHPPALRSSLQHRSRPYTFSTHRQHSSHIMASTSGPGPSERPQPIFIDLTGDSPVSITGPTNHSSASTSVAQQAASGYTLPRWQPDSEAAYCPVCGVQFSFFNRRHHCRKCGRVVCATCSPHRITIPRPYIVQPPSIDMTGEDDVYIPSSTEWGGEEVRVCNPCVPDPNLSPPAGPQGLTDPFAPTWQQPQNLPWPSSNLSATYHRPSYPPQFLPHHHSGLSNPQVPFLPSAQPSWNLPPSVQHPSLHGRSSSASASLQQPMPGYNNRGNPFYLPTRRPDSMQQRPVPQPTRRQIAEEDECPICSEELPPKGPNGEVTDREEHVAQCIKDHMYTSTPTTPASERVQLISGPTSDPAGASSASLPNRLSSSLSRPSSSRPRRMTGGRMLVYKATEKDCMGDDSHALECVICLEEFEVGDDMGRLECLCKFHKKCIADWWGTKGRGTCPTHQLHD